MQYAIHEARSRHNPRARERMREEEEEERVDEDEERERTASWDKPLSPYISTLGRKPDTKHRHMRKEATLQKSHTQLNTSSAAKPT